jgi:hypothetical protein
VPQSEALSYIHAAISDLKALSSVSDNRWEQYRRLVENLITQHDNLRAPATLGLVAATGRNSQRPEPASSGSTVAEDPAEPALQLGNELLYRGDYESAKIAYLAAMRTAGSRHQALSTALYGACEALLGNDDAARASIEESLIARLRDSVEPDEIRIRDRSLTREELRVLRVMSAKVSYDLSQISSKAGITPSRCDAALLALKGIGAVETLDSGDERTRYRSSTAFALDG